MQCIKAGGAFIEKNRTGHVQGESGQVKIFREAKITPLLLFNGSGADLDFAVDGRKRSRREEGKDE